MAIEFLSFFIFNSNLPFVLKQKLKKKTKPKPQQTKTSFDNMCKSKEVE